MVSAKGGHHLFCRLIDAGVFSDNLTLGKRRLFILRRIKPCKK